MGPVIAVPYWEERWLAPYAEAVRREGAAVRPVAMRETDPGAALDGAAGLMLIGGGDIEPGRLGVTDPTGVCRHVEPQRDAFELAILDRALGRNLPVLAICRGHQVLAVLAGAALHLDIATELPGALPHACDKQTFDAHVVTIAAGTRLARILGAGPVLVNSRHHQAVRADRPGRGLVVAAAAADGVVEAVESTRHAFVLGVQWHPEDFVGRDDRSGPLFRAFVERGAEATRPGA